MGRTSFFRGRNRRKLGGKDPIRISRIETMEEAVFVVGNNEKEKREDSHRGEKS